MKKLLAIMAVGSTLIAAPAAQAVQNFTLTPTSSTTLKAKWECPSASCEGVGFSLALQDRSKLPWKTAALALASSSAREYEFTGLNPNTEYGLTLGECTYAENESCYEWRRTCARMGKEGCLEWHGAFFFTHGTTGKEATIGPEGPFTPSGPITASSNQVIEHKEITNPNGDCITIPANLMNIMIRNNVIKGCRADGIHFDRPGNPPSSNYSHNILIANNTITEAGNKTEPQANADDLTVYANELTVENNDISKGFDDSFDAWGNKITIRHNAIHDIGPWGVTLAEKEADQSAGDHPDFFQTWTGISDGAEGNPLTNLVIEQNTIKNITGNNSHGVMIEGPGHENWIVRNNLFQNIGEYAMNICTGIRNLNIYNNTFYEGGLGADSVALGGCNSLKSSGTVADNIFSNGDGAITGDLSEVKEGYNLYFSMKEDMPAGTGDKTANPLFVNPGTDFHLQPGSPALGSGDNATIINPTDPFDLEGNPWEASSRGAYR